MEEDKEAMRLKFLRTVIIGATIAITLSCAMGMGMLAVFWYGTFRLIS